MTNGVGDQVREDLVDPVGVGMADLGVTDRRRDQPDLLLLRQRCQSPRHRACHQAAVDLAKDQFEPLLVHPAEIHQVLEQRDGLRGGLENIVDARVEHGPPSLPNQQLGPAERARQGVPEIVVHHRDEPLPRPMELLRLFHEVERALAGRGTLHRLTHEQGEERRHAGIGIVESCRALFAG